MEDLKIIQDPKRHLICPTCSHPIFKEGPSPEVHEDDEGQYVICSICHEKVYINKPLL